MLLYIVFNFLFYFHLIESTSHEKSLSSLSYLNAVELENDFKYEIDIDKSVKLATPFRQDKNSQPNFITIKSVYGQTYECYLPNSDQYYDNDSADNNNNYNDNNADKTNQETSSKFNFTLVHEKIEAHSSNLKTTKNCIYKNLGWWTYELCFGSHIFQYHLQNNGSIMGEKINLGNFSHDFNWLEANTTSYPISSGILYHEQYFEMGNICELNQRPRKSIAKIFCDETNQLDSIDLISEIETCVYEIHINSRSICKIPYFSKKPNSFSVNCNPVVESSAYEKYTAIMKDAETRQQAKKSETIPSATEEMTDLSSLFGSLTSNYLNAESTDEEPLKNDDFSENESSFLNKLNQIKSESVDKLDKLNPKENAIESLSKKLTSMIDQLMQNDYLEGDEEKETYSDLVSPNEMDSSNEALKNKLTLKTDQPNLDDLLDSYKTDSSQSSNKLTNLEKKLSDELSKNQVLVNKFKTNNLKVKIIRINPNNPNELTSFDEESADDLSLLMTSLFANDVQSRKLKDLKSNYEYVFDEKNIDTERNSNDLKTESQMKNKEDDTTENLILF